MEDVPEVAAAYRAVLTQMHLTRIGTGGKPKDWNRLVDRMQRLHLRLASSPEGRRAITEAATAGANETLRLCSAANALAWDADLVRPVLEAAAARDCTLAEMEAKIVLREFEAGRLRTNWHPKGR